MPPMSAEKVVEIITKFISNEKNMKTVIDLCTAKVTDDIKDSLKTLEEDVLSHMDHMDDIANTKESLEKRVDQLERQITTNNILMDLLHRKLDDTEQYTRRPNLIIDGVHVKRNETPKELLDHITSEILAMKIDVRNIDIDRVHRHEEAYRDYRGNLIHR